MSKGRQGERRNEWGFCCEERASSGRIGGPGDRGGGVAPSPGRSGRGGGGGESEAPEGSGSGGVDGGGADAGTQGLVSRQRRGRGAATASRVAWQSECKAQRMRSGMRGGFRTVIGESPRVRSRSAKLGSAPISSRSVQGWSRALRRRGSPTKRRGSMPLCPSSRREARRGSMVDGGPRDPGEPPLPGRAG